MGLMDQKMLVHFQQQNKLHLFAELVEGGVMLLNFLLFYYFIFVLFIWLLWVSVAAFIENFDLLGGMQNL